MRNFKKTILADPHAKWIKSMVREIYFNGIKYISEGAGLRAFFLLGRRSVIKIAEAGKFGVRVALYTRRLQRLGQKMAHHVLSLKFVSAAVSAKPGAETSSGTSGMIAPSSCRSRS